ncbi:hypothetical protein UlMin_003381 [Ulmus minor]
MAPLCYLKHYWVYLQFICQKHERTRTSYQMGTFLCIFSSTLLFFLCIVSFAVEDSISLLQSIGDEKTIVSSGGSFELGFFSPGSSNNRYLGIWYANIPVRTVVWVANRCKPIKGSSGLLMINRTGNLVLFYQNKTVVWSASTLKQAKEPKVQLLDTGNLVLIDAKEITPEIYLWQSFDFPSDSLLPGMKLGWDLKNGLNRRLSAWKSFEDPCPANFTYGVELEPNKTPELYIRKNETKYYRSGPWNGLRFSGVPEQMNNDLYGFNFVNNDDEAYYMYNLKGAYRILVRVVLNQTTSTRERRAWLDNTWKLFASTPVDNCDKYGFCGANGNCWNISGNSVCKCLQGFKPKSPEKWGSNIWSEGCIRNTPLKCQDKDGDAFVKVVGLKLPDTSFSWLNKSMDLMECKAKCLSNCSCVAYTNSNITGQGSGGCINWVGDLMDIRQFSSSEGQDLYIRMPASELEKEKGKLDHKVIAVIVLAVVGVVSGTLLVGYCIWRRRMLKERNKEEEEDLELPLFDLATISSATNNFSSTYKLGEGGFGPVYKGTLVDGKEIAVKRLSRSSGQGLTEFKNEVTLIAKLQHRNLVKLIGCCIQGEENLLVYEYMPNKSLDFFIFDFGMARICGGDLTEGNTNRVVGTYGYMAPEYASDGIFSVKSDVFSFGILVLEIITGKKNRGFFHADHTLNLAGHAWRLWKEGNALGLIDESLVGPYSNSEVLRCIHVSLLCVQQHLENRPTMSSVVFMLGSQTALAQPDHPGFFIAKRPVEVNDSSSNQESFAATINEVTLTVLEAR